MPRAIFIASKTPHRGVSHTAPSEVDAESCGEGAKRRTKITRGQLPDYESPNALSSVAFALSIADLGVSGMSHFTLPALISSCAMRQGLRDPVSMTGGAPPCSCRARRAATKMYR